MKHVSAQSEMPAIIIQHLQPKHKGIMVELLQRTTTMKVKQIEDQMEIKPNNVYVISPNKDLCLMRRVLHLMTPTTQRDLRLPIDIFSVHLPMIYRSAVSE